MLDEVFANLRKLDIFVMLRRDDNRIDSDRFAIFVEYGDLRLAVRTKISERAVLADFGETAGKLMRKGNRQRHVLFRLVRRIAEHHALVAGADGIFDVHIAFAGLKSLVDALGDIRRLLVKRNENAARIGIEAVLRARVADFAYRFTDDFRDINVAFRRNLTDNMDLSRRHERLAGDTAVRVFCKDRIEDAVRNLVGHFVRMTFCDGFRRKQHAFFTQRNNPLLVCLSV